LRTLEVNSKRSPRPLLSTTLWLRPTHLHQPQAKTVRTAPMDLKEGLVLREMSDLLDPREIEALKVPLVLLDNHLLCEVHQVCLDPRVTKASAVLQGPMGLRDLVAPRESTARPVQMALQVLQVQRENRALLVILEAKATQGQQGLLVPKVTQGLQELLVLQATVAHPVTKDRLVPEVRWESLEKSG